MLDLLKQEAFGSCSKDTINSYTENCSRLFPMATVFRPDSLSVQSSSSDRSKVSKPDKIGRKNQLVSNVAMSVLSGDINDGSAGLINCVNTNIGEFIKQSDIEPDKVV